MQIGERYGPGSRDADRQDVADDLIGGRRTDGEHCGIRTGVPAENHRAALHHLRRVGGEAGDRYVRDIGGYGGHARRVERLHFRRRKRPIPDGHLRDRTIEIIARSVRLRQPMPSTFIGPATEPATLVGKREGLVNRGAIRLAIQIDQTFHVQAVSNIKRAAGLIRIRGAGEICAFGVRHINIMMPIPVKRGGGLVVAISAVLSAIVAKIVIDAAIVGRSDKH